MIRKTMTILSLIGLLLSVGLWGFSYYGLEFWRVQGAGSAFRDNYQIVIVDGRASCHRSLNVSGRSDPLTWYRFGRECSGYFEQGILSWWRPFVTVSSPVGGLRLVQVWLWFPVALFACPCYILLRPSYRRRKRKKLGLCVECGYDLRASKDRCPECGSEFETTCSARP